MINSAQAVRRIVVSRLRHLGDVVLTTPTLEVLREHFPQARLDYLTQAPFAGALKHHPCVDRLITLPLSAGVGDTLRTVRRLRRPRVDWFFDLFANPRATMLVALARPRVSVGTDQGFRSRIYTHRREDPGVSQIELHLDKLVPLVGAVEARPPRIYTTAAERTAARERLGLGENEVLVHPGASHPWRVWPTDRWPGLIERILSTCPDASVRVVSPPGDVEAARRVAAACSGAVTALPPMGLRELLAALAQVSLYVGNDGGILHCAVGLGVPTVGIIGGENRPAVWFPYESFGPYRAVHRLSSAATPGPRGRHVGLPDASRDDVMAAVSEVWP